MIKLESSKVARILADNINLALRRLHSADAIGVRVSISSNKMAASFNGATFAAAYTAKGWRPLPAMTSLAGKKLYTDDEAATAVQALFTAAEDARAAARSPNLKFIDRLIEASDR